MGFVYLGDLIMKTFHYILILVALAILSVGCKKEGCTSSCATNYDSKAKKDDGKCTGCTDPDAANYCEGASIDNGSCTYDHIQLSIEMLHNIGSSSVEFDTMQYVNAHGNTYSVEKLRYFVSDFYLVGNGVPNVLIDEIHYVDAREPSTLTFVPNQTIPNGNYSGISFVFGISDNKNTSGLFVNPPESNMSWPDVMGGGYHFMKLEGYHDDAGVDKSFLAHTGGLNDEALHVNVTLANSAFTADGTDRTLYLSMDINNWFENPNTLDLNNMAHIMADSTKQHQMQENGWDVFTATIQ